MKLRYLPRPWKRTRTVQGLDHAGAAGPAAARPRRPGPARPLRRRPERPRPRGDRQRPRSPPLASITSSRRTSSMTVLAGRRFWASPIRPVRRSLRICSCNSGSKPLASRIDFRLPSPCPSSPGCGKRAFKSMSVEPASRGCVRQAAAKRVISFRVAGTQEPRLLPQPLRRADGVIGRRHDRLAAFVQLGRRAAVVDRKIVDHRVHREGQRALQLPLDGHHLRLQEVLGLGPPLRDRR